MYVSTIARFEESKIIDAGTTHIGMYLPVLSDCTSFASASIGRCSHSGKDGI
jgi:hypothetical protein